MAFHLMPRNKNFFKLFRQYNEIFGRISCLLRDIAGADRADSLWSRLACDAEHDADQLTRDIIKELNDSFIVPFDREDIYLLATRADSVIDHIEDAIGKIADYDIAGDPSIGQFITLVREALVRVSDGMEILDHIAEGERLEKIFERMDQCEHEADLLVRTIINESYEINVMEILGGEKGAALSRHDVQRILNAFCRKRKIREVAEIFERAVDAAKAVFHALGNIKAKNA